MKHYFGNKGPSSQGYGFSSGLVRMWELDCEESWAPKNWCFWTVVLEETPESNLDCKEIKPVNPKGNQSWIFTGKTDAKAKTPVFGHLLWRTDSLGKTLMLGKIEGRRRRVWQRMGWLDGITDSKDILHFLFPSLLRGGVSEARGGVCSTWTSPLKTFDDDQGGWCDGCQSDLSGNKRYSWGGIREWPAASCTDRVLFGSWSVLLLRWKHGRGYQKPWRW